MASRRRLILESGVGRLEAIRKVDGFNTDGGLSVLLNETPELGPDDPDVVIAVLIGDDEPKQQGNKIFLDLPIELQAIAKVAKPDVPADAWHPWIAVEDLLEDIKRAWELNDRSFGGLLSSEMERGVTRTAEREAGSTTVGLSINYSLRYSEHWGQPGQ